MSGPSGQLPLSDVVQRSFGKHNLAGVRAHTHSNAVASTKAMGAKAFTRGNDVVFNRLPSLFTVAHEAAHVVQQRRGVSLSGNVGSVGDR